MQLSSLKHEHKRNKMAKGDVVKDTLNPKQKLFCKLYASDREFFGNGVQAYIEAYDPDTTEKNWYKSAQASASRLLSNVIICQEINSLLETSVLNDVSVDKQLAFLITQHDDKGAKSRAISEYNKLKNRITERIDHTTKGEPIKGFEYVVPHEANNTTDA